MLNKLTTSYKIPTPDNVYNREKQIRYTPSKDSRITRHAEKHNKKKVWLIENDGIVFFCSESW